MITNAQRLSIAITLGILLEILFLLFGLHASLWLSKIADGRLRLYWVLNGVYFVLGISLGLLVVRWAPIRIRILAAGLVLLIGAAIGSFQSLP